MSEWRETNFGEVIDVINGFAFKSANFLENMTTNSLPVIKIKNVANGNVHLNGVQYHAYSENLSKYIVKKDDVLVALTGNHPQAETQVVGLTSRYKLDCTALINQRVAKVISKNEETLSTDYIYYFLKDTNTHLYLASRSSGSANQANISKSDIENIPFSLPPENEQQAIAAVLSSLDDKIDLLHRQNKTLEAMAETLFKQWFVVEAREDWEDWEEKPLSQVANFLNGLACQKYPPENAIDKFPVLKIRELNSGISESSDWASSTIKPEYIVENGDIIFAWSASLMVKVWHGETCILNQHLFKVTSTEFPKWFYLMWCKHHLDEFISISSSHATTMGHIKRGDLDNAMVLIPTVEELEIMTLKMTPILNKQIANQKQIQTLETLRDNLLPKLMSGEIRVSCL
ncbi:MAG: restriction endonuclease subunit S [Methylovulum sp.]|nr:restriction endonuclease subunit S [Methylovulum sp.]